jgi:hypothetical protein
MTITRDVTTKDVGSSKVASWILFIVDGALLVASAGFHLDLWNIAYRHVPTLGPLFLIQVIAAFVIGLAIIATRHLLAVLAGLGLALGTIAGFLWVRAGTLFGFHLPFVSGEAWTTLVVEIVAVVLLAATAAMILRARGRAALFERPGR